MPKLIILTKNDNCSELYNLEFIKLFEIVSAKIKTKTAIKIMIIKYVDSSVLKILAFIVFELIELDNSLVIEAVNPPSKKIIKPAIAIVKLIMENFSKPKNFMYNGIKIKLENPPKSFPTIFDNIFFTKSLLNIGIIEFRKLHIFKI